MKTTLMIAPAAVDLAAWVDKLPRGNEDEIQPKRTLMRYGGAGWCAMNVWQAMGFPYEICAPVGSGIYGDAVKEEAESFGLQIHSFSSEIAGCSYTMIDPQGQRGLMIVPGCEYTFDQSTAQRILAEQVNAVLVFGGMLDGENGRKSIQFLKQYEGKIFLELGGRGATLDEASFNDICALHPVIHATDEELSVLCKGETDLMTCAQMVYKKTNAPVIVLLQDGGSLYAEGRKIMSVSSFMQETRDASGVEENHAAAYLAARVAGVDPRNALNFAGKYAARIAETERQELSKTDIPDMKQLLLNFIMGKHAPEAA